MTNRDLTPAEQQQLELLVDATGVQAVLEALSTICGLKAEHIAENWQNASLARAWRSAEGRIAICSTSRDVAAVSR
jgi:hypothetical protein